MFFSSWGFGFFGLWNCDFVEFVSHGFTVTKFPNKTSYTWVVPSGTGTAVTCSKPGNIWAIGGVRAVFGKGIEKKLDYH